MSNEGHEAHHLHLVPTDSRRFREELLFRDRLRTRAELAEAYSVLKRSLAKRFEHDREAYTTAKSAFIRDVLEEQGSCRERRQLAARRANSSSSRA